MNIHPTAIVEDGVELGTDITIGPYSIVKGKVKIGDGTRIESHVVIGSEYSLIEIGKNNHFLSGAMIGGPPQDLKYNNEQTRLLIGDGNTFREFVTVNCGTVSGGGITKIGDHCLLMAYVHIAHDCTIGNHVVIANTCQFAGHVTVEDHAKIGGVCMFNQWVRVGKHSFVAGDSAVNKDILPFSIAQGRYAVARAANSIGLERDGFKAEDIDSIYKAIRIVTKGDRTIEEAIDEIKASLSPSAHIEDLVKFISDSERGIAR